MVLIEKSISKLTEHFREHKKLIESNFFKEKHFFRIIL